jgi:hypothetical protein
VYKKRTKRVTLRVHDELVEESSERTYGTYEYTIKVEQTCYRTVIESSPYGPAITLH